MTATATQVVREHVRASKQFRSAVNGSATKSRAFLIEAGILAKNGKRLAKRYR